jgi:hypothetical protein
MSLLVPVLTAEKKGVASGLSKPNAHARVVVRQDVGDDEAGRFAEHARAAVGARRRRSGQVDDLARDAAVRQRAIRVGQRQQRDVRAAEREAEPVVIAFLRERQAERSQRAREAVRRDEHERAHGRHVQRAAERAAYADPALEILVVVLRNVEAAAGREVDRRVVE